MTTSTYDEALRRVLAHEGGYTDHPADPGGPTNFGITLRDARAHWRPNATAADLRAMPVTIAKHIYRAHYAAPLRYHDLPAGVDYALLDYGINSGVVRSAKVLQRLVGTTVDGEIGSETLAAVHVRDPKVLVAAICDERLVFLRSLRTWPTFGRGWSARVAEVRKVALVMAGAAQNVTPIIPQAFPALAVEHSGHARGQPQSARKSQEKGPLGDPRLEQEDRSGNPPWLERMNAILGLYEFGGAADNPAIIGMAKACGGKIARTYQHDATPWCALAVNYCLIASGLPGNDSLWALDFARYGKKLAGPAVGAIACKRRQRGGHVFLVFVRTADV
jgi:uncharacterized protein (TIGR02594 family)